MVRHQGEELFVVDGQFEVVVAVAVSVSVEDVGRAVYEEFQVGALAGIVLVVAGVKDNAGLELQVGAAAFFSSFCFIILTVLIC
jgi:hypothetical protein